jgi:ketosteroid isomerase-like protein
VITPVWEDRAVDSPDYEDRVRQIWAAWQRGGVEGMRAWVDDDVEWSPSVAAEPIRGLDALDTYWRSRENQQSIVPHAWEQHGECVLVHGSMRTFRDGGFVDVQPSWVYFFRDGRLTRATAYSSREDALAAIDAHCASAK